MTLVFHKMTGSGNDFVFLDGRISDPKDWPADRIRRVCDRREGIGGDGLVFVTPVGPNKVSMVYFNSDGSRAAMCGNAALCTARLAARLEMADAGGLTLVTDVGEFAARCTGPGHLAEIHLPDAELPVEPGLPLTAGEQWIRLGMVGVPHAVIVVGDVAEVDVEGRGREIRQHALVGAAGANANFISRISHSSGTGAVEPGAATWAIRTFERGVEAETLACGTGTVAAALAIRAAGMDRLPLRFRCASQKVLSVTAEVESSMARDIWLCGEGRLVAKGVWFEG